jgi:hypothetical protein
MIELAEEVTRRGREVQLYVGWPVIGGCQHVPNT